MTGAHARAARALLGWTQMDLARHAKVGVRTVKRFENGEEMTPVIVAAIGQSFREFGIMPFSNLSELAGLNVKIGVALVDGSPSL
jgi:transcriptional regulator with XRE-family HTH domain